MRKILPLVATLALGSGVIPSASAAGAGPAETFGGQATARALDVSLLGRNLRFGSSSAEATGDALAGVLNLVAAGEGTGLAPGSGVTAAMGGANATPGGRSCAQLAFGKALAEAGLPQVVVAEAACGRATAAGDVARFSAEGAGGVPTLSVKAAGILGPVLSGLDGVLAPLSAVSLGELGSPQPGAAGAAPAAEAAAGAINGLLGGLLGTQAPVLPALVPTQTLGDLVGRLEDTDLVRFDVGDSTAATTREAGALRSSSRTDASAIEVLPAFRGTGLAPLLRISTSVAEATATYDPARGPDGSAQSTLVRVESELLGSLPLGRPGTAGAVALPDLVGAGGLRSGAGFVELAPGQSLSVFCDGPVAPLCTDITVGQATRTTLPDGRVQVASAPVTVHLFKGLDSLVPGAALGSALAGTRAEQALAPVLGNGKLVLGPSSAVTGIKLDLARATAEAGGSRVLGAAATAPPAAPAPAPAAGPVAPSAAPNLPRTGGSLVDDAPFAVPALFGGAAGLRFLARRRPTR